MSIVIFGGDRLGNIPKVLEKHGFRLIEHVTGRKKGDLKTAIHREAEGVLVFTDFLNHKLALGVKAAAKRKGLKVIFVKRSCSQLREALLSLKTAAVEGKS
ncbi:MAG TPA: dihydroorotate dehydrogenase [Firmicutes bacterium]|nr:dihydroorotate dehydrogenase [Bacillota bacterium]